MDRPKTLDSLRADAKDLYTRISIKHIGGGRAAHDRANVLIGLGHLIDCKLDSCGICARSEKFVDRARQFLCHVESSGYQRISAADLRCDIEIMSRV